MPVDTFWRCVYRSHDDAHSDCTIEKMLSCHFILRKLARVFSQYPLWDFKQQIVEPVTDQGDVLLKIDRRNVNCAPMVLVAKNMLGKKGTPVLLTFLRSYKLEELAAVENVVYRCNLIES